MGTTDVTGTDLDAIAGIVDTARDAFLAGRTRPLDWRITTLRRLEEIIRRHTDAIAAAMQADLGRSPALAWTLETGFTINDINHTLANLPQWVKPTRVPNPLATQPGTSKIVYEPLGVACVIAPWNYPLQLSLVPAVAAIAAGNAVVVKPSEIAAATAAVIETIVSELADPAVQVVQGGVAETTRLLEQRFDHIFYTGNGNVGRVVMRAAAEHLTPVTLELGGKSPAIVSKNANVEVAARRITWGKFINAGQTCVAPDYVLVDDDVHDELVQAIRSSITRFYGTDPRQSADLGRIVSEPHFHRVEKLLGSGTVAAGGSADVDSLYIEPTVLTDVSLDDPVMQEEIFGPVLPIIKVGDLGDAVQVVNRGEKPLALYVFTEDQTEADHVIAATSSGGALVNHTLMHLSNPHLPFGGVGESGMGAYHGRHGFEVFSHHRAVLQQKTSVDPPIMYPPYTARKAKLLERLLAIPDPRDLLARLRNRLSRRSRQV